MGLDRLVDRVYETDVLIMGGGIAGCYAAAKAAGHGLDVILAEKANTRRSGSAAMGMDHYEPVKNDGVTNLEFVELWEARQSALNGPGRFTDPAMPYTYFDKSLWVCEESERLGLTMKWDDGEFYFMPLAWYGGPRLMLRVHWQDCKPILSQAAKKKGARMFERTMIVDLLTKGNRVVGATALNTRTGEFMVIKAKATVVATGIFARCYEPEEPLFYKYQMKYHWCPASISGDGYAAAYRAGAEIANMDITGWGIRIRDDLTISYGNISHGDGVRGKWYTWDGEEIPCPMSDAYRQIEAAGKDPIYASQAHLSDDYHRRMEVAFADEKLISFKVAEDRMFNPRSHRYELMENHPLNFVVPTGVVVDEQFKSTNMEGLWAIGDGSVGAHGCGCAAVGGIVVGDSMNKDVSDAPEPDIDEDQVMRQKETALAPLSVSDGTEPIELELSTRYICRRYVGMVKNEGRLREGQRRLGTLKREFIPQMAARDPHGLMRAVEARNIMDLTEVHIAACLERKETRGQYMRADYTEINPTRTNMSTYQWMENGEPRLEIREVPELKPEYAREGS